MGDPDDNPIAAAIAAILTPVLGPFTARTAVKTFAQKTFGIGPESLTERDVPALAEAMRPLLKTFVGREQADQMVERIKRGGHR